MTHPIPYSPKSARALSQPMKATKAIKQRLEELRGELRAEQISYGELHELQSLKRYIQPGDVELLEAAGVPEHPGVRCANCEAEFDTDFLTDKFPEIPGLLQRIEPGGEVPAGECPECGALCYLIKKEASQVDK